MTETPTDPGAGVVVSSPTVADPAAYEAGKAAEKSEVKPVEKKLKTPEEEGPKSLDDLEPESEPREVGEEESKPEGEEAEGEEAEGEPPEMEEFDFGGNKLEVPKDSVPPEVADKIREFSKGIWADYTRKSQAIAETTKTLEARENAVAKLSNLNGEVLQTYSQGLQLRSDIAVLQQVDLKNEWQSNPDRARQISDAISQKQADFNAIVARVGEQEGSLNEAQQGELARRSKEGETTLDNYSKGFAVTIAPDVVKYAMEDGGFSAEEAEKWRLNPVVTKWAHKAMLFDRMQARAKAPPNPSPVPVVPIVAPKGKGASKGSSDPDKMSLPDLRKHLGISA